MMMNETYSFRKINNFTELLLLQNDLNYLDNYYPDFDNWYINKVIPGIICGSNNCLVIENKSSIIGISLFNSHKLQAIRIYPNYQQHGYGFRLLDETLKQMDCDKPLCTVAEEMLHLYSRMFINHYKFTLPVVEKGLYRQNKLEYIFNEDVDLRLKTPY